MTRRADGARRSHTMFGKQSDSRDDYQPLGYVGGFAVYVTTLLVIVYIAAMVALVLVQSARGIYLHVLLQFGQVELVGGRAIGGYDIWRFFTYPLVNAPSIWFAVEMYLLAFFGREVERFIGRRSFGMLYFMLVLLAPCVVLVTKMWLPPLAAAARVRHRQFRGLYRICDIVPGRRDILDVKGDVDCGRNPGH